MVRFIGSGGRGGGGEFNKLDYVWMIWVLQVANIRTKLISKEQKHFSIPINFIQTPEGVELTFTYCGIVNPCNSSLSPYPELLTWDLPQIQDTVNTGLWFVVRFQIDWQELEHFLIAILP